jgi:hypothetical protein
VGSEQDEACYKYGLFLVAKTSLRAGNIRNYKWFIFKGIVITFLTEFSQNSFVLVAAVTIAVKRKFPLYWKQAGVIKGH